MIDKTAMALEQYEVEVYRTARGRGVLICDTDKGPLVLQEYTGNVEKLPLIESLLKGLKEKGLVQAEEILPTKEDQLYCKDADGRICLLKTRPEGRECSIQDKEECLTAVRCLAKLHLCMKLPMEGVSVFSPAAEYEKHNRELKKVKSFLKSRSQKTPFEIELSQAFSHFMPQALKAAEQWKGMERIKETGEVCFCHGDYQYHNLLMTPEGPFVINFEKCVCDNPVRDLYLLMRKLLEKSGWSVSFAKSLLDAYCVVRPLSDYDRRDLYYRFAYPEKFWKIANFYYNSRKAWIPERNHEKLVKLLSQETEKDAFLRSCGQLILENP